MSEMNWWTLMSRHWGKVLGGVISLLFAVLAVAYGFWSALFIYLCVAVGLYLGWRLDTNKEWRRRLARLLDPDRGD